MYNGMIQLANQLPKLLHPEPLLAAKIWTWTSLVCETRPGPLLAAKTGPGGRVLARTTFRIQVHRVMLKSSYNGFCRLKSVECVAGV